ncbi:MAG: transposase [Gemmatimonadaceae bacterium]
MATSLQHSSTQHINSPATELRLLYALFEEAQGTRIAHGERIRALLQGRSSGAAGALPFLQRAYERAIREEEDASADLETVVARHPAWVWLQSIKGIGHRLAARLLSRLDISRADTPSSFWAYCGLATVPGAAFRCHRCGLDVAYPLGYAPRETHLSRSGLRTCSGELRLVVESNPVRVAPRRTSAGGRRTYDAHARKSCYLIGVSLLRCGSDYREHYDAERARVAATRPGWTPKRCHLASLRKMEKMFLRDLWIAWRRAENLSIVPPYFPRATEPC